MAAPWSDPLFNVAVFTIADGFAVTAYQKRRDELWTKTPKISRWWNDFTKLSI